MTILTPSPFSAFYKIPNNIKSKIFVTKINFQPFLNRSKTWACPIKIGQLLTGSYDKTSLPVWLGSSCWAAWAGQSMPGWSFKARNSAVTVVNVL
jgi:hypothetical protein